MYTTLINGLIKIRNVFAIAYDLILSQTSSSYIPPQDEIINTELQRQKFWDKLSTDAGIELVNHIRAFSEYDPATDTLRINAKSMYAGMVYGLGIDKKYAVTITAASKSLPKIKNFHSMHFSLTKGIYGSFSPDDAPLLMHPDDTGFYDRHTGRFNATRFNQLHQFSVISSSGVEMISKDRFEECKQSLDMKDQDSHNDRWPDADMIDWIFGKEGHQGEIGFAFDAMTTELIDGVPHVALNDLETFYRNTATIMADRTSLCRAPGLFDQFLQSVCEMAKEVVDATPHYRTDAYQQKCSFYQPTLFNNAQCPVPVLSIAPPSAPLLLGR